MPGEKKGGDAGQAVRLDARKDDPIAALQERVALLEGQVLRRQELQCQQIERSQQQTMAGLMSVIAGLDAVSERLEHLEAQMNAQTEPSYRPQDPAGRHPAGQHPAGRRRMRADDEERRLVSLRRVP
ncbi:MAG: hypothetical protein MRY63_06850 [Neomegalonema sp.]|nr:hypothetical protein [Neomegalonema sp.]